MLKNRSISEIFSLPFARHKSATDCRCHEQNKAETYLPYYWITSWYLLNEKYIPYLSSVVVLTGPVVALTMRQRLICICVSYFIANRYNSLRYWLEHDEQYILHNTFIFTKIKVRNQIIATYVFSNSHLDFKHTTLLIHSQNCSGCGISIVIQHCMKGKIITYPCWN